MLVWYIECSFCFRFSHVGHKSPKQPLLCNGTKPSQSKILSTSQTVSMIKTKKNLYPLQLRHFLQLRTFVAPRRLLNFSPSLVPFLKRCGYDSNAQDAPLRTPCLCWPSTSPIGFSVSIKAQLLLLLLAQGGLLLGEECTSCHGTGKCYGFTVHSWYICTNRHTNTCKPAAGTRHVILQRVLTYYGRQ